MLITHRGFDYNYLLLKTGNDWARSVVDNNRHLRPGERMRLHGALTYPDVFQDEIYEYLFYKALRTSEDSIAQRKASQLARLCGRFTRIENFLAMRERRAMEMEENVIPLPLVNLKRPAVPAVNPPAAGFGVFFGLHPTPVAPIFRPAALSPAPVAIPA